MITSPIEKIISTTLNILNLSVVLYVELRPLGCSPVHVSNSIKTYVQGAYKLSRLYLCV